jgi:MtrB/PioB family decaheme-associated outer membrane protein
MGGRSAALGFVAGCCLAAAGTAARADVVDAELRLGGRTISGDTHSSKFEEYRDLEPGLFGGANFLITDPNDVTFLWGDFENIGYDDQRYSLEAGQWGRFRLFGEYSELPHVFSNDARTLYSYTGSNLLLLDDNLQGTIQDVPAGATQAATRSQYLGSGSTVPVGIYAPFAGLDQADDIPLEYQLRTTRVGLIFDPREDLEFETAYRSLDRSGRKPFALGFGSPGGTFANFASPVDERTDEVTADVRFGRGPWNLEVGYLGSFFGNDLNQVTVDNPLRLDDSATAGPGQGRISLAPDNSMNNFRATGAYELPFEFPARIATTFSYGLREQDDDFLPHTINSAINAIPANAALLALPEDSLDGKVQTYLANVLLTARPVDDLDLRARYRYYDFHNDTPVILFPGHVVNDQTFDDEVGRNVPNDYERQQASFDASYRFARGFKLRGGPFWDQWSRSRDREVSRLDEYGGKFALDLRPARWALVRADYLLGVRKGTEYNTFDYLAATLDPERADEAGITAQLSQQRKFDEADRTRNEIKLLTQLMPREDLDLSFSAGWGHYDYPHSNYGVSDDKRWNLGTEIGYQPVEWFSMSAWYSFEHLSLQQKSRWRPVNSTTGEITDDPANDWNSESTDLIHALGANLDFVIVPEKLDLSFSYTFERGNGQTHANGADGCVPAPPTPPALPGVCLPLGAPGSAYDGGNAVNYPDIEDRLQLFATTLRYHIDEHFTIEGMYAFQKLSLQDYRVDGLNPYMPGSNVNGGGVVSPSLDVFLGDRWGDYKAHIFALSAIYRF